jgi:hypothetical protein
LIWGENEQIIPFSHVEAPQAATADAAKHATTIAIPNADHGYGFYSDQTRRFTRRWCGSSRQP